MKPTSLLLPAAILSGGLAAMSCPARADVTLTLTTVHSSGANTSLATAQPIGIAFQTLARQFGLGFSRIEAQNSDTVLQNGSSFSLSGQPVSPQYYPFGAPNFDVRSDVEVLGHVGPPGSASAGNYFSSQLQPGDAVNAAGIATDLPIHTLVSLYLNGTFLAIAEDHLFLPLAATSGTWTTEITGAPPAYTSGFDYRLKFLEPLLALSQFTTNIVGSGEANPRTLATMTSASTPGTR
jgi:hypothetical protein